LNLDLQVAGCGARGGSQAGGREHGCRGNKWEEGFQRFLLKTKDFKEYKQKFLLGVSGSISMILSAIVATIVNVNIESSKYT
jgi:hypothetical protein